MRSKKKNLTLALVLLVCWAAFYWVYAYHPTSSARADFTVETLIQDRIQNFGLAEAVTAIELIILAPLFLYDQCEFLLRTLLLAGIAFTPTSVFRRLKEMSGASIRAISWIGVVITVLLSLGWEWGPALVLGGLGALLAWCHPCEIYSALIPKRGVHVLGCGTKHTKPKTTAPQMVAQGPATVQTAEATLHMPGFRVTLQPATPIYQLRQ